MPFPLDEKFLVETENKLGARFPDSFREITMKANGGGLVRTSRDNWWLHPILDTSTRKRLSRTCNDVVRETDVQKSWSGWPENGIVIGQNGSGDILLFLKNEDQIGPEIYEWWHETREVLKVADDFSELERLE